MKVYKFIIAMEAIVIFLCAFMHLMLFFVDREVPLEIYPFMAGLTLLICLFVVYILYPLVNWFL